MNLKCAPVETRREFAHTAAIPILYAQEPRRRGENYR